MALGPLTLSVTDGVQGLPFASAIVGLTTGKVEVLNDGSPGFSTVNGRVMSSGLPYATSTVVLREYEPGVGVGYRDSRIEITAATKAEMRENAVDTLDPGRTLVSFTPAGEVQPDQSIVYQIYVRDDLGATLVSDPAVPSGTFTIGGNPLTINGAYFVLGA